jgi:hypothetical protein
MGLARHAYVETNFYRMPLVHLGGASCHLVELGDASCHLVELENCILPQRDQVTSGYFFMGIIVAEEYTLALNLI